VFQSFLSAVVAGLLHYLMLPLMMQPLIHLLHVIQINNQSLLRLLTMLLLLLLPLHANQLVASSFGQTYVERV
jgi:hypothetical protein